MTDYEVHASKKDLAAFRRRVAYHYRKHPKAEYIEGLLIRQDGKKFTVVSFERLWIEKRTKYEVQSNDLQYQELKNRAYAQGLRAGTIHTHTISDSFPSKFDMVSGIEEKDALVGICEVDERKSGRLKMHIDFWVPQLPAEIYPICD
jgi:proteasome lid subunit RPN8/RPN11